MTLVIEWLYSYLAKKCFRDYFSLDILSQDRGERDQNPHIKTETETLQILFSTLRLILILFLSSLKTFFGWSHGLSLSLQFRISGLKG